MGLVLLVILSVLEIALAVRTCRREKGKKAWRKNRLLVRIGQAVIVGIAMLLPLAGESGLLPNVHVVSYAPLSSVIMIFLPLGNPSIATVSP